MAQFKIHPVLLDVAKAVLREMTQKDFRAAAMS
jgi:hypothetical protein